MKGNLAKTTSIRRRRGAQAVSVANEGAYGWQAVSPLFCFFGRSEGPLSLLWQDFPSSGGTLLQRLRLKVFRGDILKEAMELLYLAFGCVFPDDVRVASLSRVFSSM